jgi:NADH-quinone oxidoreductase subunit C
MNLEYLKSTAQVLKERFGIEILEFRGEAALIAPPEKIVELSQAIKSEFGFEMLTGVSAVDYFPQEKPRFHVIYIYHSIQHQAHLVVRVPVPAITPTVPTIEKVYPNANWYEREVYDMFGIHIDGHSDLRRIIMPADWVGHPLRKDYPLGYEEVRFSFNQDDLELRKPTPQE